MPQLAGRNVLLHEDKHAVYHVLEGLTSRSPVMMEELRRIGCLPDTKTSNYERATSDH
jgi:hypothetical protein